MKAARILCILSAMLLAACSPSGADGGNGADLILTNARVYTLNWDDPALDGRPAANAPWSNTDGWRPDAQAIAISDDEIVMVGSNEDALRMRGDATRIIDLGGAVILPGLVDSHAHIFDLGAKLDAVDLTHVKSHEEAISLIAERAKSVPEGQWIFGAGWDEGAWANNYPDKRLLSEAVPNHPVALDSLHGFAIWVNQAALDAGGITRDSKVPTGGEMRLGADGQPNGLFINRATEMIDAIIPPPSKSTLARQAGKALQQMASDGYVTIHEAGASAAAMEVLGQLEGENRLPIRVYAMLSLRDAPLMQQWIKRGPDQDNDTMLVTRAVKAYYDGALGSRGARLLADYEDRPGHRGISGAGYGFDRELYQAAMEAGFQFGIHAIGDAGNREVLDIFAATFADTPAAQANRHRIEHAQVVAPADFPRFSQLGIIASMEPPHAVEDKAWAQDRLGPDRIRGAYAWRTLRQNGAHLTFNADNPGSDHSIFYGLHAAVTRRDKQLNPSDGWYPEQALTIEEAIRAYTIWSAYAAFREGETGIIAKGRWADLTVMDIDPFILADQAPQDLLNGEILITIVNGRIVYENK